MNFWTTTLSVIFAASLLGFVFFYVVDVTPETNGRIATAIRVLNETVEFDAIIGQSDVPVLIDFYADWCGPCRTQGDILHDMKIGPEQAQVVKVNVDDHPELARRFEVTSIPRLMVFRDGEVTQSHVGLAPADMLAVL